jgi:hypothetical protein
MSISHDFNFLWKTMKHSLISTLKNLSGWKARAVGLALAGLFPALSWAVDCQLYLGDTSIDYGDMTRAALLAQRTPAGSVALGKRTVVLNAACKETAELTLFLKGPSADPDHLRFSDRGKMAISVSHAQVDGAPVNLSKVRSDASQAADVGASLMWGSDQGIVPVRDNQVVKGRHFSLEMAVEPSVPADATLVGKATQWSGHADFTFVAR